MQEMQNQWLRGNRLIIIVLPVALAIALSVALTVHAELSRSLAGLLWVKLDGSGDLGLP